MRRFGHTPSVELVDEMVTERGSLRVEREGRGVMLTTLRGHCDVSMGRVHVRAANAAYALGDRIDHFFDMAELTGYEPATRIELTKFAIANRAQVSSAHFFVTHRLVAMGVATASLAARLVGLDFVVHRERAAFVAELRRIASAR